MNERRKRGREVCMLGWRAALPVVHLDAAITAAKGVYENPRQTPAGYNMQHQVMVPIRTRQRHFS